MISLTQAAELLSLSTARLRDLCGKGRMPGAIKVGRNWILPDKPTISAPVWGRPRK
mgnify:CR=1 FL=1